MFYHSKQPNPNYYRGRLKLNNVCSHEGRRTSRHKFVHMDGQNNKISVIENDHFSFPGIGKIQASPNTFIKILWSVAVVTFYSLCFYQLGDRLSTYLKCPTSIQLNVINYQSIEFPSMTVCPGIITKLLVDYCESNLTITSARNFSSSIGSAWKHHLRIPLSHINITVSCSKDGENDTCDEDLPAEKHDLATLFGMCTTFSLRQNVTYRGAETFFSVSIDFSEADFPDAVVHFLNTRINPCIDYIAATKCSNDCINKYLNGVLPCRLPFLNDTAKDFCSSQSQFCAAYLELKKAYLEYEGCNCPRSCNEDMITYEFDTYVRSDSPLLSTLKLIFPDNSVETISEVYIYGLSSFVSEIGGSLGCCAGLCLFNFVELIEYILRQRMKIK